MTFVPRYISSMISETLTSRSRTLLAARMPGVLEPAMHLRLDARPPGPPRLDPLLEELAEEQRERAQVAGRAEEEAQERLAVADALRLVLDGRRREVRPRRVAGHEVADARAVVREQALAVRQPADDLARRRRDCSTPSGAAGRARTSGTPGCRRCCRGGSRPGWRTSSTAGSPPSATACACRSRTQRAIVLTEPARIRPARIGWARPSIWMITRPGLSDCAPSPASTSRLLDEQPVEGVAAVDAEDRREDRVDDRVDERADERREEAVDVDARRQRRDHAGTPRPGGRAP